MIYTVTFNPAIDYVIHADSMKVGEVNRSHGEEVYIGGKGINVSLVLSELGIKSKALGFVAGFTGDEIISGLEKKGIDADFVRLKSGFTRINVKIKSAEETELNGKGPHITDGELLEIYKKLEAITDGDTIILAGSIPSTLPSDIYEKILEKLSDRKIKAVVDATGELLKKVLKFKPFLVKPNNFELGEMFGVKLTSIEEIECYAKKLREMGAENVIVSMAKDGALLVDSEGKTHVCGVCSGKVVNSVGAGDSMVAGFVAGSAGGDYEYALKLGTACGGATAFSEWLAEKKLIDELLTQL